MHIVLPKYENVVTDFNLSLSSVRICQLFSCGSTNGHTACSTHWQYWYY